MSRYDSLIPNNTSTKSAPVAESRYSALIPSGNTPAPTPATPSTNRYSAFIPQAPAQEPEKPSLFSKVVARGGLKSSALNPETNRKIGDKVANFFDTPENKTTMPELPANFKELPYEEKKRVGDEFQKANEEWAKQNSFKKQLPSNIIESLPFGIGAIFKTIHEEENAVIQDPSSYETFGIKNITGRDLLEATPKAVVEAGKGFVKAPISGALNIAGLTGAKLKYDIPGLGEVSNAQYKTAERVANGENPVVVSLEEGSNAILDTLFFASMASKAFTGRPTVTARSEISAENYAKTPESVKNISPKSFRLYEQKTTADVLPPEFIQKAQSQGVEFGKEFNPADPTYFKMTFDPKSGNFRGEIVQIRPSFFDIVKSKFGGDITKAPAEAFNVISTPKETSVAKIEEALKKPIVEHQNIPKANIPTTDANASPVATGAQADPIQRANTLAGIPEPTQKTPKTEYQVLKIGSEDVRNLTPEEIAQNNLPSHTIGGIPITHVTKLTPEERAGSITGDNVPIPYTVTEKGKQAIAKENKPAKTKKPETPSESGTLKTVHVGNEIKEVKPTGYGVIATHPVFTHILEKQTIVTDRKTGLRVGESRFKTPKKAIEDVNSQLLIKAGGEKELKAMFDKGHENALTRTGHINEITSTTNSSEIRSKLADNITMKAGETKIGDIVSFHDIQKGKTVGLDSKKYEVISLINEGNKNEKIELKDSKGNKVWTTPESIGKAETTTQKEAVKKAVESGAKTIKQISEETKILEPNVRRILGVGAKEGTFERVEKGVYVLSKGGEDMAWVQTGDAVESLPKLAKEGFKADMVFLDIPYDTPAVKGGNRGVAYNLVSVEDFGKVLDAVKDIARKENTPVIHMYSQAESGMKAMQRYNDLFLEKGFKPVGKGEYQKTFKDGITPTTSPNGKVAKPEGILVFTQSGELDKKLENLNFKLVRPNGYQTEKPAEMLKAMIEMTTNKGDVVLDPFAGSGVTGAEAVKAGRKAHLIEKNPDVAKNITLPRVKNAISNSSNFIDAKKYDTLDEFIKAHGDSFYHTTPAKFDKFDRSFLGTNTDFDNARMGFFFTDNLGQIDDFKNILEKGFGGTFTTDAIKKTPAELAQYRTIEKITKKENFFNFNYDAKDLTAQEARDFAEFAEKKMGGLYNLDGDIVDHKNMTDAQLGKFLKKEVFVEDLDPDSSFLPRFTDEYLKDFIKYLEKKGYKGMISNYGRGTNEYLIFDPNILPTKSELTDIWNKAHPQSTLELAPSKAQTPAEIKAENNQLGIQYPKKPLVNKSDIKIMITHNKEFQKKGILIVDAEKNLTFTGEKSRFKIKATALGLNPENLSKGDEIRVDEKTLTGKVQQMRVYKGGNAHASIGEFRDGTPMTIAQKENIKIIELPELVDLARELMGEVPKIKNKVGRMFGGGARGVFRGDIGNGSITLKADLFDSKVNNIDQVAKTLAHEIGHLIDYLPSRTLARGNLMGRLNTLKKFGKDFFEPAGITRSNPEIKEQMWALSKYWRPVDEANVSKSFLAYRKEPAEMYADFISVVFNDPKLAQEMAPTAYNVFFNQLDKKPAVQNAFFELQEILGGDRESINARRRAGVRGMFEQGDMKSADIQRARLAEAEARRKDFKFKFKFNVIDKNYAVIDRINQLKKEGVQIPDDENPLYYLEERNYIGGKVKAFMSEHIQPIYEKLQKNDISWDDFGEALFYERIIGGDRSDVANPRGITPKVAHELREKMIREMGSPKTQILFDSMRQFRTSLKDITDEAYKEGLIKPEMYAQMQENPAYATFQVLDHIEEGMTSKIHKSIGTLKDVTNPADASLLKTISTIRAIERNKVARTTLEFLQKQFPEDAIPAKSINTPKGKSFLDSRLPNQDLITYMKDGKLQGFYVDPYISKSINNENIGTTVSILRVLNSNLFRPLFITYNPGFQLTNFTRDLMRTWKNMPDTSFLQVLKRYKQAVPVAKARAFGIKGTDIGNGNQLITKKDIWGAGVLSEMERSQILSTTYNNLKDGEDIEDQQIENILRASGIDSFKNDKVKYPMMKPLVKMLDFISATGDFIETLPKVAAYLEFSNGGVNEISREQKSYIRKNIGSPDFLAGGYSKPLTNEIFLFSNSIIQGIRSDVNVATDPKTRSGYWYKTAKMNMLPKILMILASAGFFGATVKRIMDNASEYDKTNYTIIPLGEDENGKAIYFRLPQDEGGRLIGGLVWKALNSPNNKQNMMADITDIATFAGGQIPTASPVITNALATSQFIAGQNPYDWFRSRNVLTDDQFKAGGMYATKPFLGWLFNQSGGSVFYKFSTSAPKDQSKAEKALNLPFASNILGRFVKISDYGTTETLNKIKANVQKDQARTRIDENSIINDYVKEAQGAKDGQTIQQLTVKNKKALVTEILGHEPQNPDEIARAGNIIKKYQVGLQRGESDPMINSLISAQTNAEKIQLLTEIKSRLTKQEYNQLKISSLKYKIASPEVFYKVDKQQ